MSTKSNDEVSEILEETNRRVSGGHVILICKCHRCGDTYEIQRRRFLKYKPCGMCVRKNQNAWKPMFEKIEKLRTENERLQKQLDIARTALEFYANYESWKTNSGRIYSLAENGNYLSINFIDSERQRPELNHTVGGKRAREAIKQMGEV